MHKTYFQYGSDRLSIGTAIALADGSLKGAFLPETTQKIRASQLYVADIVNQNT